MRGFKKFKKAMPCRECVYRKNSQADQLLGSFSVDDGRYYFILNGTQYYCHKDCEY